MSDIIADAVAIMMRGGNVSLTTITITENGTYYPDDSYDGFEWVKVVIPDRYDEGYQAGYDDGYAKGYDDGYWTGYNNGVEAADCDGAYLAGYAAGLVGA